jgi:hypothetical protein
MTAYLHNGRGFLFLCALLFGLVHGRYNRRGQLNSLVRLLPLENTAHPLHVLPQAHAPIHIFRLRLSRLSWS